MLHSYSFTNFRSFRSRVDVPLLLNEKDAVNGWAAESDSGHRITTALAVYGANASGKTSLLQPLAFLAWFVPDSFNAKPDSPIPVSPHFAGKDQPTEFELIVDALEPGTLWRYKLTVTRERVLQESLERRGDTTRWQRVFERRWVAGDGYEVKQTDFGLDPAKAVAVRPNVSLMSWAIQFDVALAKQLCDIHLITNIAQSGRITPRIEFQNRLAEYYKQDPELQNYVQSRLKAWDFGLDSVIVREREVQVTEGSGELVSKKYWYLFGIHKNDDGTFELPFSEESSGTRAAFVLLTLFLPVLRHGGLIVFDELDNDLHPLLLPELIRLFDDPQINQGRAQIIFTCHSPEFMKLLQKSQLMLVEKRTLESVAWRMDSMKGVRSDDNRMVKYLAGEYGGIPEL